MNRAVQPLLHARPKLPVRNIDTRSRVAVCIVAAIICVMILCSTADAQGFDPENDTRGPGFYVAWWKFFLFLPFLWFWIKCADWISRDAEMVQEQTRMFGHVWNPIVVGVFLVGLLGLLFIPFFAVGYPLFVVCSIVPFIVYTKMRNKHFKGSQVVFSAAHRRRLKQLKNLPPGAVLEEEMEALKQDEGPQVDFKPAGVDNLMRQQNLITARQNPAYIPVKSLFTDAVHSRADGVRLDFTQDAVNVYFQIDGMWQPMPGMDRQSGDAMLHAIKSLANLNPNDRRSKQKGEFFFKIPDRSMQCRVRSQGTKSGETAVLTIVDLKAATMSMEELGMPPEMLERLDKQLHTTGFILVSAMPGDGLSSSWVGVMSTIDRVTRELVAIVKPSDRDRGVENITFMELEPGEDPMERLNGLLLKEPDGLIFPDLFTPEITDKLSALAVSQTTPKMVLSHVRARSATEAILRVLSNKCDRKLFAQGLSMVLCQRLVRRLCPSCRQTYQATPELAKKLGFDPKQPLILHKHYEPLPEELVDDRGRELTPPVCEQCAGVGYFGRMAVYEMLEVNDLIRKVIAEQPKREVLDKAARKSKHRTIQQEGVQAVINGDTSLSELQRVLQAK